ncbi:MAG TPA: hypothetical protein VMV94_11945 [Phycisphaerae bacterium]|nr:hypothetical protein [Phycisphaerae bacterium]
MSAKTLPCLAVVLCLLLPVPGTAAPRPITALVPGDCLVAYMARPYGTPDAPTSTSMPATSAPSDSAPPGLSISSIVAFLSVSGLIPDEGQVFADIAAALPLLGKFEHAVVLLDISSRIVQPTTRPGANDDGEVSLRLKDLQAAVIFRTEGDQKIVLAQINRIVGRYTNADVAALAESSSGGYAFQRLTDERLPGWAIWEWGRLDDFFVVTFGAGAFERIVSTYNDRTRGLAEDAWFTSATAKTGGNTAIAQWFIALSRLEERLTHVAQQRHTRVIRALEADDITHDLWTVGRQGPALTWYRCYRRNGEDITRRYSDPGNYPPEHRRIIPTEASHFAIIHVPTRWLVDNLPRAWLAAQSESHVRAWSLIWNRLEEETGIDIRSGLIDHLGENVVIFDYPQHPLKVPFALTIAIEIDNRKAVQMATDTLLGAWRRYLDEGADQGSQKLLRVKVRHDADGVWYLQAGILGPAIKVTDRYIVISWSPQALRDALVSIERFSKPSEGP